MLRRRILYAEDDLDMCELVQLVLADDEVTCVYGCEHAIDRIKADPHYDLYILDYYLPDNDGITLCETIRESDRQTPILFVTGSYSLRKRDVERAGGQALIRKSGRDFLHDLRSHVKMLLESRPNAGEQSMGTAV
jgi:CheY-like chemotaxis protein